jgi:C1A family cysteine protease
MSDAAPPDVPTSFGYLPDPPDTRDLDMLETPGILKLAQHPQLHLHKLAVAAGAIKPMLMAVAPPPPMPPSLSLRDHCMAVVDQGQLNSCTAHAASALMGLVQCHLNKQSHQGSRLFLYYNSRKLLHFEGDKGAYLRTAAGVLTIFGQPPEEYWPYVTDQYEVEPTSFCYLLGQRYRATSYFRIDSDGVALPTVIERIRHLLNVGLPTMFGYDVYFGAEFQAREHGDIPLPLKTDLKVGGHALMICGYDDTRSITNSSTGGETSVGAFQVQNSRGTGWGDSGFGWIPYEYFLRKIAVDCWSVINMDWVDLQPYSQNPTGTA